MTSWRKRIPTWRILAALLGCGFMFAAGVKADATPGKSVRTLVARYRTASGADVGAHVIDLADGAVLCDINADRPMIPASNQKILTSAVAIKRLGPEFGFGTKLAMSSDDLVVTGDGDPTTGDARLAAARNETVYATFDRWADALKEKGVRQISDLIIRAGIFRGPCVHPDWPVNQRQRWYAAPVAGVNFNDNCLDIGFAVRGRRVWPLLTPRSRFIHIDNRVKAGKRHVWFCRFDRTGRRVNLSGTVTRSTPDLLPVAVPNPPIFFGCVLAERLARAGIAIKGNIVVTNDWRPGKVKPLRPIATARTPLSDVLLRTNKQSLNMMAECLLLRSAVGGDEPATWKKAAETARKTLIADYGLKAGQFTVADGSGFSRRNRAAPMVLTTLLRKLSSEAIFVRSLSVAGADGSLRRRFAASPCRRRILGKTGSLNGVSALSGYVLDNAGKPKLAFSIIINGRTSGKGYNARTLQQNICELLVRAVDAPDAKRPASQKASRPYN